MPGCVCLGNETGHVTLLDPADLDVAYLSKRHATGWGYHSLTGESVSLVGVPVLKNNLYVKKD